MVRDVDPQTKRFFASVITTYLSIVIALLVAFLTTESLSWVELIGLAVAGMILALVAEYYLTYGPLLQYREKQLTTFFGDYLRLIEQDIENVAFGDIEVRANIMRPTSDGFLDKPTYSITYWHDESDYSRAEFELEFEIGEGCVGRTHESDQQMFAISPDYMESWDGAWNTSGIQEEIAGHLNTIIGTPIYRASDQERNEPVAVLIIDSENSFEEFVDLGPNKSLADIEFEETPVAERAVDHARNAGILL